MLERPLNRISIANEKRKGGEEKKNKEGRLMKDYERMICFGRRSTG
jgi:hypothetical protein